MKHFAISQLPDGSARITPIPATATLINCARMDRSNDTTPTQDEALAALALYAARKAKITALDAKFAADCRTGASVTVGADTFRIPLDERRNDYAQLATNETNRLALAADDAARAAIFAETFAIYDAAGSLHPMTIREALTAIATAGEAYKALFATRATKLAAVAAAADVAAVNAITV